MKKELALEEQYRKLDEVDHVLLRPGRYVGSITSHTNETYVIENDQFHLKEISYTPAFIKIFDEIITNSVDHSKTEHGKSLDTIKVDINKETGIISVYDNGGIPVIKHKEHNQYIPEMIFELRSGSNFNDDVHDGFKGGTHGEGAALCVILSTEFKVETCDGKNKFVQVHTNNSRDKSIPVIKQNRNNYTRITYSPDYPRFNMEGLDEGNYEKLVKRVYDVAGCNPKLKIYLNGERIEIKSFKDYIQLYTKDFAFDHNDHWNIGVSKSNGSFSHVSFVNGVESSIGGNHVNYIADQITNKLREYITKKHKIQIKPGEIKNHLNLFIDCNILNPKYSSQTKEDLITEVRNFGTTFDVTDKFIGVIIKSDIVQSILDWAQAKENAMLQAELRKLNKNTDKVNPSRVPKFDDASSKTLRQKCILFLAEGASAAKPALATRTSAKNPEYIGVFELKGKPINVNGIDPKRLMDNDEFKNILTITGLKLGEKATRENLRFGKICIMSDADNDGIHVGGLIINMLYTYWPELFDMKVICRFKTPIIRVYSDKKTLYFYTEKEFIDWRNKTTKKFTAKYFKGLGTYETSEFKKFMENLENHIVMYELQDQEDRDAIALAFGKESGKANNRKDWLDLLGDTK